MYKNSFKVHYMPDKIANIGKEIPWQEQCMFTELMVKYLPKHIKQMIPQENQLVLEWDEEESFNRFVQEDLYLNILEILSRYEVFVEWN